MKFRTTRETYDIEPMVVRCRSCGAALGMMASPSIQRNAVYCDIPCVLETPVTPEEERNDWWRMLNALGVRGNVIAEMWNLRHPAVYRVLNG